MPKNKCRKKLNFIGVSGINNIPNANGKFFENRIDDGIDIDSLEEHWFNSTEAAEYLRITPATLRNLTSNGQIPYYKFQRTNRYLKSELRNLLLANKRGGNYGY